MSTALITCPKTKRPARPPRRLAHQPRPKTPLNRMLRQAVVELDRRRQFHGE